MGHDYPTGIDKTTEGMTPVTEETGVWWWLSVYFGVSYFFVGLDIESYCQETSELEAHCNGFCTEERPEVKRRLSFWREVKSRVSFMSLVD